MDKIPIIFTFNNAWAKTPAFACITSLLENAAPSTQYEIMVVSGDVSADNQAALVRQVNLYKRHSIRFVRYELKKYHQPNKMISLDSYTRFFLPDVLSEYRKVIYADSDIIFLGDLSDVFNTDISNDYLGVVLSIKVNELIWNECWPEFDQSYFGHYFNSGFLLMNLELMRENRMPEKFEQMAQDPDRNYRTSDQCIANKLFYPKVHYLPLKYNFYNRYASYRKNVALLNKLNLNESYFEALRKPCVIHFTWIKPWQLKVMGCASVWWHYARKTPCYWDSQKTYLAYQIKHPFQLEHFRSALKRCRQRLFQVRWGKDKKIIRLFGIPLARGGEHGGLSELK